ncbi:hypothetical protein AALB64_15955 [Lachnospiraceae bacterium 45-P1]
MAAFYQRLVELEIVEGITEYDLPEKLKEELTGTQSRVPDTILGRLRVFAGGR